MKRKMTQADRLDYLVREFAAESDGYQNIEIPDDEEGKRTVLRSLMNIRMPDRSHSEMPDRPRSEMPDRSHSGLSEEVIRIQDEYLKERAAEKGVVTLADIPEVRDGLSIWQGDITRLAVDAIVNAANSQMLGCFVPMHACIDNCIHTYAGIQLREECNRQMQLLREADKLKRDSSSHDMGRKNSVSSTRDTDEEDLANSYLDNGGTVGVQDREYTKNDYEQPTAVPMLTDAYNLPANKVIHIVGPIVQLGLTPKLEENLADCYRNVLDMCLEKGLRSVAFCCISTGVFRFPNERAAEIAVATVSKWMIEHPEVMERVIFNVFKDIDYQIYDSLLK